MPPISAVAFDVGETLIDESRVWIRHADRLGLPAFTLFALIGASIAGDRQQDTVFDWLRPELDIRSYLREVDALDDPDDDWQPADLYPDARPTLAALRDRGVPVAIAGNQPPRALAALRALHLPCDLLATSADWGISKPDPEFFRRIAAGLGLDPAEILYVGDRLDNDIIPARSIGMSTALIKRGPWGWLHAHRDGGAVADHVIAGLAEVVALTD
ncbi:MAG: HAD family hydrolase [Acidimicrobiia bacterium]